MCISSLSVCVCICAFLLLSVLKCGCFCVWGKLREDLKEGVALEPKRRRALSVCLYWHLWTVNRHSSSKWLLEVLTGESMSVWMALWDTCGCQDQAIWWCGKQKGVEEEGCMCGDRDSHIANVTSNLWTWAEPTWAQTVLYESFISDKLNLKCRTSVSLLWQ